MTARQAIEKGIRRVRLPNWDLWTYLELPARHEDGTHGPWALLYDPISSSVLQDHPEGVEAPWLRFPIAVLFTEWDTDDSNWEEFTGPRFTPDDIRANRHIQSPQS